MDSDRFIKNALTIAVILGLVAMGLLVTALFIDTVHIIFCQCRCK